MQMVRRGRYDEAMAMMEDVSPDILRTLRFYQYWTMTFGILKLRRALHR